jgi:alcohol dehydrogenase (cytochrome c)
VHFQTTPREGWDYDGVNEVVAYKNRAGEMRYATADRNGFFYVLNREDGKFVRGVPFVKDISWASGLDENGRPIFVEENRPGDPSLATDGNKGETIFAAPSFLGGKNWMPMAFSQRTGNFYVPSTNGAWISGTSLSPIKRVQHILDLVSPSNRCTKTISVALRQSTQTPVI